MFISLVINILIVFMVGFSLYAMYTGYNFMGQKGAMEAMGKEMFRYYTIDSNILMGICILIMAVSEITALLNNTEILPECIYLIKYMGISAVMLTFLVTAFFLVPQFKNPIVLYYNSNLFFHAVVPLLAILSFVVYERSNLSFINTIYGVLPTAVYAIYYVGEIYKHLDNGKVDKRYDFYNFTGGKKEMTPVAAIVVLFIAYFIGVLIWFLN